MMKGNFTLEPDSIQRLSLICKEMEQWPSSWAGEKEDIPVGEKLLNVFQGYLIHLMNKGRTKKTIKKQADYLWALGGEIIRDTSENDVPIAKNNTDLVLKYVHEEGGTFWKHAYDDNDSNQYNSICRQLYRFLSC